MENSIVYQQQKGKSFDQLIQDIEKCQDTKKLYNYIIEILQLTNKLSVPLQFKQNLNQQQQLDLLVLGEVGNGKSTTLNHILYQYCQMFNFPYDPKKDHFISKKSVNSVTQEVSSRMKGNINLIDSPGTNDPNKTLDDAEIARKIHAFLQPLVYGSGLSGILQCIMVDPSGRIRDTTIRSMSRTLMSFTFLYPDFDINNAPRLNVLFTNYSLQKIQKESEVFSLPCESMEEEECEENQVEFSKLKQIYKEMLFQQSIKETKGMINQQKLKEAINAFLPDDHFYAFKLQTKEKMQKENEQIQKLIVDNFNHGKWKICNPQESAFEPVQMEYEMRDQISEHILDVIRFCSDGLQQANLAYKQYSEGETSQLINENLQTISQIQEKFMKMIQESPCSLQKCPLVLAQVLQKIIQKMSIYFGQISAEEIGKFGKEKAKKQQEFNEKLSKKCQQQDFIMQEQKKQMEKEKLEMSQKLEQLKEHSDLQISQHQSAMESLEKDYKSKMEKQEELKSQFQEELAKQREYHKEEIQRIESSLKAQYQQQINQIQQESMQLQQQQQQQQQEDKFLSIFSGLFTTILQGFLQKQEKK